MKIPKLKKFRIPELKIPRHKKNPESQGFSAKSEKIPVEKSNLDPDPRDFEIFRILHSGLFRAFHIPIPILGISGFSGFFDLAQCKKSLSCISRIGIRDPEKSHPAANYAHKSIFDSNDETVFWQYSEL